MAGHKCVQEGKIAKIETTVALTNNDISYMKQEISEIKDGMHEINNKMDNFIDKMEKKFASKWVEWVVKGLIGVVLVGVVTAVLGTILK